MNAHPDSTQSRFQGIRVRSGRSEGVRIEAEGAAVDALYRAHLTAYGARDLATRDVFAAVLNRRPYIAEASPDELLPLADALEDMGLPRIAVELRWHEAHARAEALREQAWELESEADRLEAMR